MDKEKFTQRLKSARISVSMTQRELGRLVFVAPGTISSYETGWHMPPLETAARLANVLGVSLDWLCGVGEI